MVAPIYSRRSVLAAAIEATAGTAESLDAGDAAFNIMNTLVNPDLQFQDREGQGGFDNLASVPLGYRAFARFRAYVEWDGTATEPAWAETFLPACGWVKSGQTYKPLSGGASGIKTLTIAEYIDNGTTAVIKKISGAMGTFVVTMDAGAPVYFDFDFLGAWAGVTDGSQLAPTYPTVAPIKWSGGVAQWNDVNLLCKTATIDAGNQLYLIEDPSTDSAYTHATVTTRRPTIVTDPLSVLEATQPRWASLLAMTEYALELHAGGPGNSMFQFDAPKAQIISMNHADRERLLIDQLTFGANKNGATQDESLSITFTAST